MRVLAWALEGTKATNAAARLVRKPWLWTATAAGVAVQSWFRPGRFYASGDVPPFMREAVGSEYGSLWTHYITGSGSPSYAIARAFEVWIIRLVDALGGSPHLAQRLFYTALLMAAVGTVTWCVAGLTKSRAAAVAAGAVVLLNPFWITKVPNPLIFVVVAYLGLIGGVLVRVAKGERRRASSFALTTVGISLLALNTPLLAVLAVWPLCIIAVGNVIGGKGGAKRTAAFCLRASPWTVLVNLWWLIPLVITLGQPVGFEVSAQTSALAWAWTHVNNSISNVGMLIAHWAWGRPEYVPVSTAFSSGPLLWALWVLPLLVLATPLVVRRQHRRLAWTVLGSVLVLLFLSKGLHAPFSGVNAWLYRVVPGSFLFREPFSKLGPVVLVLYATMIGLLVDSLAASTRIGRRTLRGAAAAGMAVLVATGFPIWTGAIVATERPIFPSAHVHIPSWWTDAAEAINDDPSDGKLLTLPLNDYYQLPTTWGYYGVDHTVNVVRRPVMQLLPGGYFSEVPSVAAMLRAAEQAVLIGDDEAVPRLLRALGVSLVLVRGDLDLQLLPSRHLASPASIDRRLRDLPSLQSIRSFGPLELYRVRDASPSLSRFDRAVIVPDNPAAVATATASLSRDVAVVTETGAAGLPARLTTRASVFSTVEAADDHRLGDGPASLVIRPQHPQIARVTADEGALVFHDAWTVSTDRSSAEPQELARIGTGDGVVRGLVVDGSGVALGASGSLIQVPGPTTIIALGDSDRSPTLSPPSSLGDCNAKEDGLSPELLGLRAVDLPNGVRLQARRHQACVAWDLDDVQPGSWLDVSLDHRSVSGRPARLCLFDMGSRRCLPIMTPSAGVAWSPFHAVVRIPEEAGRLRLHAYADGAERIDAALSARPTVTEYRNLEVRTLEPVGQPVEVRPSVAPVMDVTDEHGIDVRGPVEGNVIGEWGPLGDCNRYDERSAEESGLSLARRGASIELRASAHSACVSAPIDHGDASSVFELSMRYRAAADDTFARVCVYDPMARVCLPLLPTDGSPATRGASLPATGTAMTFRARFAVPQDSRDLRLYVYADGSPVGTDPVPTGVVYQDVMVTPQPPFSMLVTDPVALAPNPRPEQPNRVTWDGSARVSGLVHADRRPIIVATHESAAPGWQAHAEGSSTLAVTVNGYRSGWLLVGNGDAAVSELVISYSPARLAHAAIAVSVASWLAAALVASGAFWALGFRKRSPSDPSRARHGTPSSHPRVPAIGVGTALAVPIVRHRPTRWGSVRPALWSFLLVFAVGLIITSLDDDPPAGR